MKLELSIEQSAGYRSIKNLSLVQEAIHQHSASCYISVTFITQKNTNGCGVLIYANYALQNFWPIRDYINNINNVHVLEQNKNGQKLLSLVSQTIQYMSFKKHYTQDLQARLKTNWQT